MHLSPPMLLQISIKLPFFLFQIQRCIIPFISKVQYFITNRIYGKWQQHVKEIEQIIGIHGILREMQPKHKFI